MKHVAVPLVLLALLAGAASAGLSEAATWLKSNQQADGSYGAWAEHQAAAAAMGMFLGEGNSPNVSAALGFLKTQLENPGSWFWGAWGEADVPGACAYAFAEANQTGLLNYSIVAPLLLAFQPATGFKGYYDFAAGGSVESSVDTALSILALAGAGALVEPNKTAAINYLLSLQNADGSFNLTATTAEAAIYSLGPDRTSTTALSVLALKAANYSGSATQPAIDYVKNQSAACFGGANYSYSAAVAAIALAESGEIASAKIATKYLFTLQKSDGGFADSRRSTQDSNALDTGWAAAALAKADPTGYNASCSAAPSPTPTPTPAPPAAPPASSPSATMIVKVTFPENSGKSNVNQAVPLSSCATALGCFQQAAIVTCKNYPATGPLACSGHPEIAESCFATSVNGYAGTMGYWALFVNGAPSAVGVSCYWPAANDAVELRYSTAAAPVEATAPPAPTAQEAPSATPAPAIPAAPSPTPQTLEPSAAATAQSASALGAVLAQGETGGAAEREGKKAAPVAATELFAGRADGVLVVILACAAALVGAAWYLKKSGNG